MKKIEVSQDVGSAIVGAIKPAAIAASTNLGDCCVVKQSPCSSLLVMHHKPIHTSQRILWNLQVFFRLHIIYQTKKIEVAQDVGSAIVGAIKPAAIAASTNLGDCCVVKQSPCSSLLVMHHKPIHTSQRILWNLQVFFRLHIIYQTALICLRQARLWAIYVCTQYVNP